MHKPKLSYIINHRSSTHYRVRNLEAVVTYLLANIPDIEIIVVEQDVVSKVKFPHHNIKHIFLPNGGLFNRSWGFNVGLKHASHELLAFGDNDLLVSKDAIIQACSLCTTHHTISPYKTGEVYDLDESQTCDFIKKPVFINPPNATKRLGPYAGGLILMTRHAINTVGGWEEQMWGWGGEDDHMTIKIVKLLHNLPETRNIALHLNHENNNLLSSHNLLSINPNYFNNLRLIQKLKDTPTTVLATQCQQKLTLIGEVPSRFSLQRT